MEYMFKHNVVPDDLWKFVQSGFRAPCNGIHAHSVHEHLQRLKLDTLNLCVFFLLNVNKMALNSVIQIHTCKLSRVILLDLDAKYIKV